MEITIATSIAPHNDEVQKTALASWRQLGFNILSVNSAEEIKLLKDVFPEVTFIKTERHAAAFLGKPFVYFDDVLSALESTGSLICGIVNSDVHLVAGDDFLKFLSKEADDCLVFGSRVDVASLSPLEGEEYVLGFDFFFFSKAFIKEYIKTDFCLGVPWWDYWAPSVPLLKGFPVKQLITPVAYHIQHAAKWDQRHFYDFGVKFINYLKREDLCKYLREDVVAAAEARMEGINLFSLYMADYINQQSSKLSYHASKGLHGEDARSAISCLAIKAELAFQQTIHRHMNKMLTDKALSLENNLNEIKESLRWKLASPFVGLKLISWITGIFIRRR